MFARVPRLLVVSIIICAMAAATAGPPEPADPPARPAENNQPPESPEPKQPKPEDPNPEEPAPEGDNYAATEDLPTEIVIKDYLVVPKLGVYGRVPIHRDPLEAQLATGDWQPPSDGDSIDSTIASSRRWRDESAADDGVLDAASAIGGYAFAIVESPADGVMLLEAKGHANVYVNGRLHAGDPYAIGGLPVPVELKKGSNQFLFQIAQPEMSARLAAVTQPAILDVSQATLPDVVQGIDQQVWIGLPVTNATSEALRGLKLVANAGGESTDAPIAFLDRLSSQKISLPVAIPSGELSGELPVRIQLVDSDDKTLGEVDLSLRYVVATALQRRTFRSAIDASVQSYVLVPATDSQASDDGRLIVSSEAQSPSLLVALHDLGVTAEEFAQQLTPSSDWHIVVPTGRTPFGFDWEDWSQRDIDEALEAARAVIESDSKQIVAIGHGMGGHGVLQWGVTHPGELAAAALFGGWPSLWTYGGGRPGDDVAAPIEQLLLRPTEASDTLALINNLRDTGMMVLHSGGDDYVSIDQSRQLMAALTAENNDYSFRALEGADHQWSTASQHADAIHAFLRERLPSGEKKSDTEIEFQTADLATSASDHWVTIVQQSEPRILSQVKVSLKESPPAITGTTSNVRRIALDVSAMPDGKPFYVQFDRSRPAAFREPPDDDKVYLTLREDGRWIPTTSIDAGAKSPGRGGGLKSVFEHRPLLVYGTGGSDEQKAWAESKAHYDAEQFLYRGNGRLEVIPDTEWSNIDHADRNVVLYGNADTNKVWPVLLSTCDIQVRGDGMTIDTRPATGDDLAVIMVRPRPDSDVASVAVIGGTGLVGMQLTNRLRYFTAGIDYPDLLIFGPRSLDEGTIGIRAAGYFDGEWKLNAENFEWRDIAF